MCIHRDEIDFLANSGVCDFLGHLPGYTFLGAGFPRLFTYIAVGEHTLRVALMFLFVPTHGVRGVLYAYILSSILKSIVGWFVLSRYVIRPHISWWQSVVVPLLIAAVVYALAITITDAFWTGTMTRFMVVGATLTVIGVPLFYFLLGVLGGFDDETLAEFRDALGHTRLTQIMGQLFYRPTVWGARLSPLHGRFPLRNWDAAQEEAASLTAEKVAL